MIREEKAWRLSINYYDEKGMISKTDFGNIGFQADKKKNIGFQV